MTEGVHAAKLCRAGAGDGRHLDSYNGIQITYDGSNIPMRIGNVGLAHDQNGTIISDSVLHYLYDHTGCLFGFVMRDTGEKYLYRRDAQGNIVAILDNAGAVVVNYKYNAWGNHKVLNPDGTENTAAGFIGNRNPFRYRGYYYSDALGLYYLKSRFYDPEIGRFISADTVDYLAPDTINGLNLYAYCGNNPVMNVDPTGHAWWDWVVAVAVVVVCAVAAVATAGTSLVAGAALAGAAVGGAIPMVGAVAGAGLIAFARTPKHGGYYGERWPGDPHKPDHVHLRGNKTDVRIGRDGNPLPGEKQLDPQAKKR